MKDIYAILMKQSDQAGELKHVARQFGFSECPDSYDYKYGKNITTTRFRRHEDEHYPALMFYVQECPDGMHYGINSDPYNKRYHKDARSPTEQNTDEIREFLERYLDEVKDLPVA